MRYVERLEEVVPRRRRLVVGDAARELRQLQLVGEEPRRRVAPGLVRIERGQPDEDRREGQRGVCAIEPGAVAGSRRRGGGVVIRLAAPKAMTGSRSRSLRTNLQGTCACSQARTTPSRRSRGAADRHEHGSGCDWTRTRSISGSVPSTGTPCMRRPRSRRSSSTKPTTCSPGVSRSSRNRLRPLRPAPTSSVRRRSCRSRSVACAEQHAFGEARASDEHHRDERVQYVDPLREVAEGTAREPDDP